MRRPRKTYGINLNKNFYKNEQGEFNLNLTYKHYGKHFDTHSSSFNRIEMDSSDITDIKLSKNFRDILGYIKINNLFDETYQRPHGFNQENRLLTFGFNSKF